MFLGLILFESPATYLYAETFKDTINPRLQFSLWGFIWVSIGGVWHCAGLNSEDGAGCQLAFHNLSCHLCCVNTLAASQAGRQHCYWPVLLPPQSLSKSFINHIIPFHKYSHNTSVYTIILIVDKITVTCSKLCSSVASWRVSWSGGLGSWRKHSKGCWLCKCMIFLPFLAPSCLSVSLYLSPLSLLSLLLLYLSGDISRLSL